MLKKLTQAQQETILLEATKAFADHGMDARISSIASASGVSVGVIYKYYPDKKALFHTCLEQSLSLLSEVIGDVLSSAEDFEDGTRALIRASLEFSRSHEECIRMYHRLTEEEDPETARMLSEKIEGITAKTYSELIEKAQKDGIATTITDPSMFAFFFDNLLMMLHFSYSCAYYKERFKIYCGSDILEEDHDKRVEEQLIGFLKSALGITD